MDTQPPAVDRDRDVPAPSPGGEGAASGPSPALAPAPGFLAVLRDPAAEAAARELAWGEFVRWFYLEHWQPELEERLARRIEARGLAAHFAPGDLFTVFCYRVRERPALLGQREVPSRAWLRKALFFIGHEFEKRAGREERRRCRPGSPEVLRQLLEGATGAEPAAAGAFSAAFLTSPEAVALLRELETELGRQLLRLHHENPTQHEAWVLGTAGARYREISDRLGTTVGTVKSLVHRARETLRARLQSYLGTPGREEDEP